MAFDDLERVILAAGGLLQVTHRAPARRHRSVESMVRWSAQLLDAAELDVLTRFSVFAGAVSGVDASAVVEPMEPSAAPFHLAALADRSLLAADVGHASTRYSMLSTVRAVAERWLDESGDGRRRPVASRRVRRSAVREVDDLLRTPREAEGRRRLDELVDEVRAAHTLGAARSEPSSPRTSAAPFSTPPTRVCGTSRRSGAASC